MQLIFFAFAIFTFANSPIQPCQQKVELQNKNKNYKPRSVVMPAVECWFGDGNLLIISKGDYIQSIKLTDMANGEVTTETVSGNATSHTTFVGNTSIIIEITLSNGDVYEGFLIQ